MEDSKIKIRIETVRLAQMQFNVQTAANEINGRLKETFENIGVTPSDEMLQDCFSGEADLVAKDFFEKLNSQMSSITIPAIRANFEKSAHEGLRKFNTVRAEIIGKYGNDVFKYIMFENGAAEFSEESKQQLQEDLTVYISDPEEIHLYEQHVKACEALNEMFKGYQNPFWYQLFDFQNGKLIPNPLVQYDAVLFNIKRNQ